MELFFIFICSIILYFIFTSKSKKNNKNNRTHSNSASYLLGSKYNVAVKGLYYRSKDSQIRARSINVGEVLYLRKELTNSFDKNAVAVYTDDNKHIGYVDSTYSYDVSSMIDSGEILKCKASKITSDDIPYVYMDIYFSKK